MSIEENTYHLIDKYLLGELQGTELDTVRARIKTDPKFKEAVDTQRRIIAGIKAHREEELRAFLKTAVKKNKVIPMAGKWKVGLTTAAAVLLLAVVVLNLPQLSSNDSETVDHKPEQAEATKEIVREDSNKPVIDEETETIPKTTHIDTQTIALEEIEPPVLEIVEDDMEIAEDTDTDLIEEKALTEAVSTNDSSVAVATVEMDKIIDSIAKREPIIRKDEMLFAQVYSVQLVSLDILADDVDENRVELASTPSSTKKIETSSDEIEEEENSKEYKAKPVSRQINVQLWKSVVNFKGYKYDGKT
ncbi:MAG: hypothetical protein ACPGTP_07845, partial [Bacteroidia bacterium]